MYLEYFFQNEQTLEISVLKMANSAGNNIKFCKPQNVCLSLHDFKQNSWEFRKIHGILGNSILSVLSLVYFLFSAFPSSCMFCAFCIKQSLKLSCSASFHGEDIQHSAFQHLNSVFKMFDLLHLSTQNISNVGFSSSFCCPSKHIIKQWIFLQQEAQIWISKDIQWLTKNKYRLVCGH